MDDDKHQAQIEKAITEITLPASVKVRAWIDTDFPAIQRLSMAEGWPTPVKRSDEALNAWQTSWPTLVVWYWLLSILGFGMKRLNLTNPFLKYANEAVLPFYILHQTVLITPGYFVMRWAIPDLLKFIIVLNLTFMIVMGLYEFIVRHFNLMRFLFGMKMLTKTSVAQTANPQVNQTI